MAVAPPPSAQGREPRNRRIRRSWWFLGVSFFVLGVLTVLRLVAGHPETIDWVLAGLVLLAGLAASLNRTAVSELEESRRLEVESFARILRGLSRSVSPDAIVDAIVVDLGAATGADHTVVVRLRAESRVLEATLVSTRPGVPSSTTMLPITDLDPLASDAIEEALPDDFESVGVPIHAEPAEIEIDAWRDEERAPVMAIRRHELAGVESSRGLAAHSGAAGRGSNADVGARDLAGSASRDATLVATRARQIPDIDEWERPTRLAGRRRPGPSAATAGGTAPTRFDIATRARDAADLGQGTATSPAPAVRTAYGAAGLESPPEAPRDSRPVARRPNPVATVGALLPLPASIPLRVGRPATRQADPSTSAVDRLEARVRGVYGLRNTVAVPLRTQTGVVGAIVLSRRTSEPWSSASLRVLRSAGVEASAALARAYSHRAAEARASTDALTGLPNRRYFDEFCGLLARRRRADDAVGVLMVDIDHFKLVNDRYGHPVGDQVLRAVAAAITSAVREHDVPARFGGEEFAVLLRNPSHEIAMEVGERIRLAVKALDLSVFGPSRVTVSVGVAMARMPDQPISEIVDQADHALYRAKRGGRDRVIAA